MTPTTTSAETTNDPTEQTPPAHPAQPNEPSAADTVPDAYVFKDAEGKSLTSPLIDSVTPIFKELGLTQPQADKLVAEYNKFAQKEADTATQAIQQMGARWEAETRADPEMGPKLDQIKVEIGRAMESTLTPTEREAFQRSMNETMAGNNPAFVRAFWKMAQKIGPAQHTSGNPAPPGQNPSGTPNARPSVASAMWPKLPSASNS